MSQQEANEQARRNYALETFTLGEDNLLQIRCGGETIATVCAPMGPLTEFHVYNGTGLDDNDEEDASQLVKRIPVKLDSDAAWREAARYGYLHALGKMMAADIRAEKEDLESVWAA